jgi:hypothetical protein
MDVYNNIFFWSTAKMASPVFYFYFCQGFSPTKDFSFGTPGTAMDPFPHANARQPISLHKMRKVSQSNVSSPCIDKPTLTIAINALVFNLFWTGGGGMYDGSTLSA